MWKLCHNSERHIPGVTAIKQKCLINRVVTALGKHKEILHGDSTKPPLTTIFSIFICREKFIVVARITRWALVCLQETISSVATELPHLKKSRNKNQREQDSLGCHWDEPWRLRKPETKYNPRLRYVPVAIQQCIIRKYPQRSTKSLLSTEQFSTPGLDVQELSVYFQSRTELWNTIIKQVVQLGTINRKPSVFLARPSSFILPQKMRRHKIKYQSDTNWSASDGAMPSQSFSTSCEGVCHPCPPASAVFHTNTSSRASCQPSAVYVDFFKQAEPNTSKHGISFHPRYRKTCE